MLELTEIYIRYENTDHADTVVNSLEQVVVYIRTKVYGVKALGGRDTWSTSRWMTVGCECSGRRGRVVRVAWWWFSH